MLSWDVEPLAPAAAANDRGQPWAMPTPEAARVSSLSPALREVLELVVEGRSNREIAAARGTSERTVANQIAALLDKLEADSRFELIGRFGA